MVSENHGAGILVRHCPAGREPRYLLQKRGPHVRHHPGKWDLTAGGELHPGEDPIDGALREFREEMGEPPALVIIQAFTWLKTPAGWPSRRYTAFLADSDEMFDPAPPDAGVVAGWRWLTAREVMQTDLHPAFAAEARYLAGDPGSSPVRLPVNLWLPPQRER